jgi:hypothetical protein
MILIKLFIISPLAEWWVYWNTLVCPSIRPSLNLVYVTSHLSFVGFCGWPWSEHAHIIPISRMVDFCGSYSPFHVCLTIGPSAHLVYATSHFSFVAFYSYLVSWLAMIWSCAYYTDFTDGWFLRELAFFMFVWPYVRSHILCTQLVICRILFIFGILIGHDPSMRILYRFHGWLIFARVIALFMFVWPYVRPHILCMQLVICLLSHFIHIWYLCWPWSEL